jgi:hypothetical protein
MPRILVLGFSKGPEQNGLIGGYIQERQRFEDIPFNDKLNQMRPNLRRLLVELGVLDKARRIDSLFEPTEEAFGFASFVRCTVTYAAPRSEEFVGSGGSITGRTLELRPHFVSQCASAHLAELPASVELIVALGITKGFVDGVRQILGKLGTVEDGEGPYAYRYSGRQVVHVPHPSGGNNGAVAVFCGERPPSTPSEKNVPACKTQTAAAVRRLGHLWGSR